MFRLEGRPRMEEGEEEEVIELEEEEAVEESLLLPIQLLEEDDTLERMEDTDELDDPTVTLE